MKILFNFLKSKKQKIMVFPVVMYRWENRIIKRLSAEVLKLLNGGVGKDSLRVLWTASRLNQSF